MTDPLIARAIEAARSRHVQVPRSERKARGIVHTPSEVARYGVGRIDTLLRERLGCLAGLADRKVCALDPALGTGVWLAAWLDQQEVSPVSGPELLGYEVDGPTLDAARSLLSSRAKQRGAELTLREANTLGIADPWGEARAGRVRVILGNPPWGARSASRGLALSDAWLSEFRSDAHGVSLGERRTGVLSDDYVRFFRWALEQARTATHGCIVCLATNSSFLDGPVHRGMREALVNAFDDLEVLDLGGNALRGGDGARDENVFGVRVGACLTIALRLDASTPRRGRLSYAKLQGSLRNKLESLATPSHSRASCFDAQAPHFRFVPQIAAVRRTLAASFTLAQAFPFHREGVQTNRDALVTDREPQVLRARMEALADGSLALPERLRPRRAPLIDALRVALDARDASLIAPLSYRPLDERYLCQLAPLCHRPRPDLAQAVRHSSLCLLSARKDRGATAWNLFGVSRRLADACYLSTRSSCRTRIFPSHDPGGAPNLDASVALQFLERTGQELTVSELIAYCIGILSAESFRRDHDQALHEDYPSLPLPRDLHMFASLQQAGALWIQGWLDPIASVDGDAERASASDDANARVLRVGEHRVGGVSAEEWAFCVGDFPVLARLTSAEVPISLGAARTAFARVRMCVVAAALAEATYRATRPVL